MIRTIINTDIYTIYKIKADTSSVSHEHHAKISFNLLSLNLDFFYLANLRVGKQFVLWTSHEKPIKKKRKINPEVDDQ